jgi:hypothetical protein
MDEYNYSVFDLAREELAFAAFRAGLHVGERAPSFALEDLESGDPVSMKTLWRQGPAVMEFGSFT